VEEISPGKVPAAVRRLNSAVIKESEAKKKAALRQVPLPSVATPRVTSHILLSF
jgi:hypothetical protein